MSKEIDDSSTVLKLDSPLKVVTDIIENLIQKPSGELYKFIISMAEKEKDVSWVKEIVYNPNNKNIIIVSLKTGRADIDTMVYWNSEKDCWDTDEDGQKTGSKALMYYHLQKY